MSGGHFSYAQYHIQDIADSIEDYIYGHDLDEEDVKYNLENRWLDDDEKKYISEHRHTIPNRYGYSDDTINIMKLGLRTMKMASIFAQRIDWLLSGDDGEDTFKKRLEEELDKLEKDENNNR